MKHLYVMQADDNGNTIVHSLVSTSVKYPKKAVEMYNFIMGAIPATDTKRPIMKEKDPLDVTSEECLPETLHAFFNTVDVCKFVLKNYGTFAHFLYGLTQFEKERGHTPISPPHHLSVVSEE